MEMRALVPALALAALVQSAVAADAPARRAVSALVVDAAGKPVRGVVVFAADATTHAVAAMAVSDEAGEAQLVVPPRRHDFGIQSPTFGVARFDRRGPLGFVLVVTPVPPELPDAANDAPAAKINAPQAYVMSGRVIDEAGGPLEYVRVTVVRPSGGVAAAAFTGRDGAFVLLIPGGESVVRASALGLKTARSAQQGGRLVIVMGVAAEAQRLTITSGRVLSFRPSDSIDPEYTPPAPVKAWLRYAYGICPQSAPLKAYEKRALKKYWYLDVLRREPPNPATIATITCTTPSAYQPPSAPQGNLGGFDIPIEALPTSEVQR
jgi:Carboxypeptidase regulatory-like domain